MSDQYDKETTTRPIPPRPDPNIETNQQKPKPPSRPLPPKPETQPPSEKK